MALVAPPTAAMEPSTPPQPHMEPPSYTYLPRSLPEPSSSSSSSSHASTLNTYSCDCDTNCGVMCGHCIDLSDPDPVYLCNRDCRCPSDCPNRLPDSDVQLDIRYDDLKGWCLVANCAIPRTTYIGDYTGLIRSKCHAMQIHKSSSLNYILTVREGSVHGTLTTHIDASTHGSPLRFMNHSCSPNVRIIPVRDDFVYPRVTCWATRDVGEGEELCFSYGRGVLGKVVCRCGSKGCQGFLPLEGF